MKERESNELGLARFCRGWSKPRHLKWLKLVQPNRSLPVSAILNFDANSGGLVAQQLRRWIRDQKVHDSTSIRYIIK